MSAVGKRFSCVTPESFRYSSWGMCRSGQNAGRTGTTLPSRMPSVIKSISKWNWTPLLPMEISSSICVSSKTGPFEAPLYHANTFCSDYAETRLFPKAPNPFGCTFPVFQAHRNQLEPEPSGLFLVIRSLHRFGLSPEQSVRIPFAAFSNTVLTRVASPLTRAAFCQSTPFR